MAHPPEKREEVRRFYVNDRLSLEVAAASHGVSPSTAQRWRTEALRAGRSSRMSQAVAPAYAAMRLG